MKSIFRPMPWIAMTLYIGGLFTLGYVALNQYNAGLKNSGRAFMAGITLGLISVLFRTLLGALDAPKTTTLLVNVTTAIIGALVGNLMDPKPTSDLLELLIITSLSAIAITGLSFRIPEPTGNVFFIAFLIATLTGIIASMLHRTPQIQPPTKAKEAQTPCR